MLDFAQKRKVRSFLYNKVTLGLLGILTLLVLHSTWEVYGKKRESESMKNISQANVAQLEERDTTLEEKINKLDTDAGMEEEIRSKFSVTKSGENMVVIVPNQDSDVGSSTSKTGFWQKIWHFFSR